MMLPNNFIEKNLMLDSNWMKDCEVPLLAFILKAINLYRIFKKMHSNFYPPISS